MRTRKYTYIPNAEIESITTWNGKEIPGSKLLDGAYARGKVQYGDGGTIGSDGFTIREMNELLRTEFPYSFGFKLYPPKKGSQYSSTTPDYDATTFYGLEDSEIKQKIYFPQYKRDHSINYEIMEGDENTYFHFLLEGENGDGYVGTFGFKDRGDVPKEYVTKFIVFLQEQYGLPFQIEHKVMANGGMMAKGGYTSRHRKRTLEEKAQEMYGSDWFDLDERTRKELLNDLKKEQIIKGAKGLMVGNKYVATFTLDNGKAITKTYSTKDELDEGIGEMYSDYDVIDVKIEETKAKEEKKEEEKKGTFKLAKITEKTTPKGKVKRQGVVIEGIESDISRYDELKAIMKNAKAESDLIGGRIKEVGFQKWLELYEQNRTNPNSIDLIDGDENIMLQVKDSYKKVEPEKRAILQENYPDLLETTIVYTIDTTLLDKYGEVLTNLINNSKDIEEKDKDKLVKGESTTTIKSGSVDKLLNYPNPEEVFTLIEPVMALY